MSELDFSTRAIHADHSYSDTREVAPAISMSTTFKSPSPEEFAAHPELKDEAWDPSEPSRDVYSRETKPTVTRAEKVLEALIGQPTMLYPSGIAAFWAILMLVRPDVIAITDGYPGVHHGIQVYKRMRGEDQSIIKLDDDFPTKGKVMAWIESPLNPTGEARSIEALSKRAHAVNGVVGIDSTFAPPPIQDPFKWGADYVMHSCTKYFSGHSDGLTGSVSVKTKKEWLQLWHNRTYTGSNAGSLETWLLLRSMRTMPVRVHRQFKTATKLAQWLDAQAQDPASIVTRVWHASLQPDSANLVGQGKQMSCGSACFLIQLEQPIHAQHLGFNVELFTPAASLGGVESLIEQRILADSKADPRLVRLSVGLESFEDLKTDLERGFEKVVEIGKKHLRH